MRVSSSIAEPTKRDVFLDDDGQDRSVDGTVRGHRAVLPETRQRPPAVGLERMLRMYFVQHWFNLADVACEEAL